MENYIRVARTHYALCALYGVITVVFAGLFFAGESKERGFGMLIAAVLMVGFCGLHFALARGASRRNGVSKVVSIIIGVLMLPGFPVGTLVGAYLVWNAATEWVAPRKYAPGLAEGWPVPPPADAPPA